MMMLSIMSSLLFDRSLNSEEAKISHSDYHKKKAYMDALFGLVGWLGRLFCLGCRI